MPVVSTGMPEVDALLSPIARKQMTIDEVIAFFRYELEWLQLRFPHYPQNLTELICQLETWVRLSQSEGASYNQLVFDGDTLELKINTTNYWYCEQYGSLNMMSNDPYMFGYFEESTNAVIAGYRPK